MFSKDKLLFVQILENSPSWFSRNRTTQHVTKLQLQPKFKISCDIKSTNMRNMTWRHLESAYLWDHNQQSVQRDYWSCCNGIGLRPLDNCSTMLHPQIWLRDQHWQEEIASLLHIQQICKQRMHMNWKNVSLMTIEEPKNIVLPENVTALLL